MSSVEYADDEEIDSVATYMLFGLVQCSAVRCIILIGSGLLVVALLCFALICNCLLPSAYLLAHSSGRGLSLSLDYRSKRVQMA